MTPEQRAALEAIDAARTAVALAAETIAASSLALRASLADPMPVDPPTPPAEPPVEPPVDPPVEPPTPEPPPAPPVRQGLLHDDRDSGPSSTAWNSRLALPWARDKRGDWVDANGLAQGGVAFSSAATAAGAWSELDVIGCLHGGLVSVYLMHGTTAWPVSFAGRLNTDATLRPVLIVDAADGQHRIEARAFAHWAPSTIYTIDGAQACQVGGQFSAAVQFDVAHLQGVTAARLRLYSVSQKYPGTLRAYRLDPPPLIVPAPVAEPEGFDWKANTVLAVDCSDPRLAPRLQTRVVDGLTVGDGVIKQGAQNSIDVRLDVVRGKADGTVDSVHDDVYMAYDILLKDDFQSTTEGAKLPGPDARLGWWNKVGYWQSVSGNGGDPGDGRKYIRNGRVEYEGSSTRLLTGKASRFNDDYSGLASLLLYSYNLDQAGANPPAHVIPVLVRLGVWTQIEIRKSMNSLTGEPDALGNREAVADGVLEVWVNGTLAFKKTNMRWRRHPDIGVCSAWVDIYHGGKLKAPADMHYSLRRVVVAEQPTGLGMPTARPDSYSVESGEDLHAGRPAPPPSSFAAGSETGTAPTSGNGWLWTPGRTASGLVTQASVDTLPLNTWVRVAGSQLNSLTDALTALTGHPFSRYDYSQDGIRGTFDAWVGCCSDGSRIYYPRGGGHADNSANGIWVWDCLTMTWKIEKAPSDPLDPTYPWSSLYAKTLAPATGTYTGYVNEAGVVTDSDGLYWDRLPDNTPTSAHTYNGVWYDSTRRQIGTSRVSKWLYDLTTKTWARERWTVQGTVQTTTIYHDLHYHAATDRVYGPLGRTDSDYYQFRRFDATSAVVTDIGGPPSWAVRGATGVRLDEDRVWWSWQWSGERAAIHNMSTGTWTSLGVIANGKTILGYASMSAGVYVPTWGNEGQIIRRGSGDSLAGQWWLYDIETHTNLAYSPAGSFPSDGASKPGNKYLRMSALNLVVAINDGRSTPTSSPVMHVMRYA